jgi:FKBP-type peptidyl-prolyl cis-trans isomerase 2
MMKRHFVLLAVLTGLITALSFSAFASDTAEKTEKGGALVVTEGKTVKVDYTLEVDGKVMDSSKGRGPLEFKTGSGQMIPGFEKGVMGMKVGEKKSFKVGPEEGYGSENPQSIQEIPKNQLPPEIKPEAGMTLYAQAPDGRQVPVRVMEVKDDVVVMNFNHPLAGKTLNFDVEVLEIQ